jgi:hypothetical protein
MRQGFRHQKGEETIVRLIVAACEGRGGPDLQCRTLSPGFKLSALSHRVCPLGTPLGSPFFSTIETKTSS